MEKERQYFNRFPYDELLSKIPAKGRIFPGALSRDVQAGIEYALSTLEEEEQTVLRLLCAEKKTREEIAAQMALSEEAVLRLEKEALRKLRLPGRWNYIRHGVAGYLRKRIAQERDMAYQAGYTDGYRKGQTERENIPDSVLDMPIELLGLSFHARHCLAGAQVQTVRQIVDMEEAQIQRIRGMGPKTAAEIAGVLRSNGVTYTLWNKYHLEEE